MTGERVVEVNGEHLTVQRLVQLFRLAYREDREFASEMAARLPLYDVSLMTEGVDVFEDRVEFTLSMRAPSHYGVRVTRTAEWLFVRVEQRPEVFQRFALSKWDLDGAGARAFLSNHVVSVTVPRRVVSAENATNEHANV